MRPGRLLWIAALVIGAVTSCLEQTSQPASAGAPIEPPIGGVWTRTFVDDFGGSSLSTSTWDTCYRWGDCSGLGNNELEGYVPSGGVVHNGQLDLRATRQTVTAADNRTYPWSSGFISSKYSFRYGYAQIRASLPVGKGMWPAFWLLPQDGSWPPEVDVMEAYSSDRAVELTTHWSSSNQQSFTDVTLPTGGWHTYGIDWAPGSLTWYIDGVSRYHTTGATVPDKPMYLLANLAINGTDPPNAQTPSPSNYSIDYIAVWQRWPGSFVRPADGR